MEVHKLQREHALPHTFMGDDTVIYCVVSELTRQGVQLSTPLTKNCFHSDFFKSGISLSNFYILFWKQRNKDGFFSTKCAFHQGGILHVQQLERSQHLSWCSITPISCFPLISPMLGLWSVLVIFGSCQTLEWLLYACHLYLRCTEPCSTCHIPTSSTFLLPEPACMHGPCIQPYNECCAILFIRCQYCSDCPQGISAQIDQFLSYPGMWNPIGLLESGEIINSPDSIIGYEHAVYALSLLCGWISCMHSAMLWISLFIMHKDWIL